MKLKEMQKLRILFLFVESCEMWESLVISVLLFIVFNFCCGSLYYFFSLIHFLEAQFQKIPNLGWEHFLTMVSVSSVVNELREEKR